VETAAAACIPAFDAVPPSVFPVEGGGALSWLHAVGTMVMMQRARSRKAVTSLNLETLREQLDGDE
jgi:hypothetical protein